jgi:multisubunit Na+/H+ antiporter MnhB subunit
MKYLKELIIGTSYPVIVLFYYMVYNYQEDKNYDYFSYTLAAPLWFALWNVISLIISEKYNLSKRYRFFIVSILSLLSVYIIAQYFYNKTEEEWKFYYLQQFIKYMFVWNIIIYNLDKYI